MSRQTLCVSCYALGVFALLYLDASTIALMVAISLVGVAFAQTVMALAVQHFGSEEPDDPAELESLQQRIYR